jgi:hypothetical protein
MAFLADGPRKDAPPETGRVDYDPDGIDDLDSVMHAAIAAYVETALDGEEAAIEIEYSIWDGVEEGRVADLLLRADGAAEVAYTVVEPSGEEPWVVFEASESAEPRMRCDQPTT